MGILGQSLVTFLSQDDELDGWKSSTVEASVIGNLDARVYHRSAILGGIIDDKESQPMWALGICVGSLSRALSASVKEMADAY